MNYFQTFEKSNNKLLKFIAKTCEPKVILSGEYGQQRYAVVLPKPSLPLIKKYVKSLLSLH